MNRFMNKIMSITCGLNFHTYKETMHHMNFRMSTDKSIEWEKYNSGWYQFRECERCKKMEYMRIYTFYGRITGRSIWLDMDKKSAHELNRYINFNKKNNL
jgi:hypothetical protein